MVALRKESVDRNAPTLHKYTLTYPVALRKESVDRNTKTIAEGFERVKVALRKESVDRNIRNATLEHFGVPSLSARRAWIEIEVEGEKAKSRKVALRKESVDRNCRALICSSVWYVALRKESVDRNFNFGDSESRRWGRSPQGERG